MTEVHAAEYCGCVFESGFEVISLHHTKAGAYKAMRKHLIDQHNSETLWINGQYRKNYFSPCVYQQWRVTTHKVLK